MFAIIDIETTGGSATRDKITEIAIILHDGHQIVDEYTTLINPERTIPYFITRLTGISNEMVADAPRFYEVAKKIVEMTENRVFVGHNVNFDYMFVKQEFKNLGYEFSRKTLCTVKLSRQIIPGKRSYSLGNICNEIGIRIKNRHRAYGDALATTRLLEHLSSVKGDGGMFTAAKGQSVSEKLHPLLDRNLLENMPEETGVYYLYNEQGELIYVGKSNNIRKRVHSHLRNGKSIRTNTMRDAVADISWELTGSELVALLLESSEIKKHKPVFNRSQRRSMFTLGLFSTTDEHGYLLLEIGKVTTKNEPLAVFQSKTEARDFLFRVVEQYNLCQKLCGLYACAGACFHFSIGQCKGACNGYERPEAYNSRVQKFLDSLTFEHENFFIIDKGRDENEKTVVKVEQGGYRGFGFCSAELLDRLPQELDDLITRYDDNSDIRKIIRSFLRREKVEKVLYF
jgi:DNA polymerase III subunit epsilon